MIQFITSTAYKIDQWLHTRLGRKYRVLLTIGLMADIAQRIVNMPKQVTGHHRFGVVLAIVLELGLLIHQVAEMYERLGFREQPEPDNQRLT